ncbi:MAG: acylphosphatase [Halobacteriota archaeon]
MKRLTAIVKGRVQKVNYRNTVQEIARQLNITGYVKNIKPYDAQIVAEGGEPELKEFLERINVQEYPVHVEDLSVEWSEGRGEYEYFEVIRGDWEDELFERLDFAGSLLYSINNKQDAMLGKQDSMLEKQDAMLGKQDSMLEKQDLMLQKQDETIGEIRLNREEVKLTKEEVKLTRGELKDEIRMTREGVTEEIRNSTGEIKGEVRGLRDNFKSHSEERFNRIEKDIGEIKDRLGMNS